MHVRERNSWLCNKQAVASLKMLKAMLLEAALALRPQGHGVVGIS
jgi:hypothetical protein